MAWFDMLVVVVARFVGAALFGWGLLWGVQTASGFVSNIASDAAGRGSVGITIIVASLQFTASLFTVAAGLIVLCLAGILSAAIKRREC